MTTAIQLLTTGFVVMAIWAIGATVMIDRLDSKVQRLSWLVDEPPADLATDTQPMNISAVLDE